MKIFTAISLYSILFLCLGCESDSEDQTPSNDQTSVSCETLEKVDLTSATTLDPNVEIDLLEEVYDQFETFVREKNASGLNSIFLSAANLFITGKETAGIRSLAFTKSQFVGNVTGNPNPYELRISESEYRIYDGVAISLADFDEFANNNQISSGVDLFFYVKTHDGWKLNSTNNTYAFTGDQTDYEIEFPMSALPQSVFSQVATHFNSRDLNQFNSLFKPGSSLYFVSGSIDDPTSDNYNPSSLINCVSEDDRQWNLRIDNIKEEIYDQYIAFIESDYSMSLDGATQFTGKAVASLIATASEGWKISALAFTY